MKNSLLEMYSEAKVSFFNEKYDICIKKCERIIENNSSFVPAYILLGNAYLVIDKLDDSEKAYKRACELEPNNGENFFHLANTYFGRELYFKASENYAKAIKLGCNAEVLKKIYYIMGMLCQVNDSDKTNALVNFEKADELNGNNVDMPEILLSKTQIYVEEGRFEDAELCALQLNLLHPKEFNTYQLLFQIKLQLNKFDEALNVLKEAQKNVDHTYECYVQLEFGKILYLCTVAHNNNDDTETKNKLFNQALNIADKMLDNTNVELQKADKCEALIHKAEIYINMSDYNNAMETAKQVENLTGDDIQEYVERSYYIILNCSNENKDYATVIEYANKLVKSDNVFLKHHGYYSRAYASKSANGILNEENLNLYDEAIAHYKNAIISSPGDFMAYFYRARCYIDIGKYDEACKIAELLPEDIQNEINTYISEIQNGDE